MFFKSMFFKQSVLFLSIFAISGGATLFMMYEKSTHIEGSQEEIEKPQPGKQSPVEILLNSVIDYKILDVDANFRAYNTDPIFDAKANFKGFIDITDLEAVKVSGDLAVKANGSSVNTAMTYYTTKDAEGLVDAKMYLDYNTSHLKLDQANLFSFVDMMPPMQGVELPDEIKNIDFSSVASGLTEMEPIADEVDGKFIFQLPTIVEGLDIFFKSDAQYNFEGIRTNIFRYKGMNFQLVADVKPGGETAKVENPEIGEFAGKYQDFTPALKLIPGLQQTFGKKQNTINLDINVTTPVLNAEPKVLNVNTDISYDLNVNDISLAANIVENKRQHGFKMLLRDSQLFLNQEDVNKVSFRASTAEQLIFYLIDCVNDGTVKEILDHVASLSTNKNFQTQIQNITNKLYPSEESQQKAPEVDPNAPTLDQLMSLLEQLQCLNNWIKSIEVVEGKTIITFDLTTFGIQLDSLKFILSGNEKEFLGLDITGIKFNNTLVDVKLTTKSFNIFSISDEEVKNYVALDSAITLLPGLLDVVKAQEKFRFDIAGTVDDLSPANKDTTINGGFQFDVRKQEGYGDAKIVDGNAQEHRLRADLKNIKNSKELFVTYNEKLKGTMSTDSLFAMGATLADLLKGADSGFNAAFTKVFANLQNTPVYKAMQGDVGALFISDAFQVKEVVVDETFPVENEKQLKPLKSLSFAISGKLLGMDDLMVNIKIVCNDGHIQSINIENMMMDEVTCINMSIKVSTYDTALDATRLPVLDGYYNLNDIKFLLDMGIKTVSFEYFHISGLINLDFNLWGLKIPVSDIKVDAKIRNDHGKITAIANIPNLPMDIGLRQVFASHDYKYINNRNVTLMYKDGNVYGDRIDYVGPNLITKWRNVRYTFIAPEKHFMDNFVYYLTDFTFGLNQKILDTINSSKDPNAPAPVIHYENLISSFDYFDGTATNEPSRFGVGVNLGEITKNDMLTGCAVNLYSDATRTHINRVTAKLKVSLPAGLGVNVDIDLSLVKAGAVIDFSRIDTFEAEFAQQERCHDNMVVLHVNDEAPSKGYQAYTVQRIDLTPKAQPAV